MSLNVVLVKLLYMKDEKVLAQKVQKTLGEAWGKGMGQRISLRPQGQGNKPTSRDQGKRIGVMLHLEQDPVQRIAEGQGCIIDALDLIVQQFKQEGIDPSLLITQRDRLDKEIFTIQNLIRSLLEEASKNE